MKTTVSVLLFGITRDLTGQSALSVPIESATCVSDLLNQVRQRYPALTGIRSILVAVNGEYAEPDQVVGPNDEVVLIPPVSGG